MNDEPARDSKAPQSRPASRRRNLILLISMFATYLLASTEIQPKLRDGSLRYADGVTYLTIAIVALAASFLVYARYVRSRLAWPEPTPRMLRVFAFIELAIWLLSGIAFGMLAMLLVIVVFVAWPAG